MNRNDEHLIFEQLQLFDGYLSFPNKTGFVTVVSHMDMEICLQQHPNWPQIRNQAPFLIYDCPQFIEQVDLSDYFCTQSESKAELDHISRALNGAERFDGDPQSRSYRLIVYSVTDPTVPIAFSSFDLALTESVEQESDNTDINLIGLECDFLYAYVLAQHRNMGVGAVLGMMMGSLFWQQIHYVWQSIKDSETALVPLIKSEDFTRGGQDIIRTVLRELKIFSQAQQQQGPIHHLRAPTIISAE